MVQDTLAKEWRNAGVCEGDTLLIHSSIKATLRRYIKLKVKITPQDILGSFLKALGDSGTLLLPLFNFDFTQGVAFDIRNTPSQMGALTEIARIHPMAVRTGHPIYSFAVIGSKAEAFRGIDNFSGYGANSPFAMLRAMGGKIAVLSLPDQNSMTYYHYIEEMNEVNYRYRKEFTGEYIDSSGAATQRTYGLFVRDIERGVLTHVNPMADLLWKEGLYAGFKAGEGCGLRVIDAQAMYDFVSNVITSGNAKNTLYRLEGEDNA